MTPTLRPFDAARDEADLTRVLTLAFGMPREGTAGYLDLVGRSEMRVLDEGRPPIAACLARIPMGQFFGGRSVPMTGIAAVGVAPEARGRKLALRLMQECVREIAAEGVPLACLYASTQALYRQVGFEQAGSKFEVRVPLRQIHQGTRDLPIEPIEVMAADGRPHPRLVDSYQTFARHFDGCLDRGPFIWKRIQQVRETAFHGFAVVPDGPGGRIEGHVFLAQQRHPSGGRHDVVLSDLAFTTRRAGLRLLGFLRDFTSMGLHLQWIGGPCHPLLTLLDQQWVEVQLRDYWMLRVTRFADAIAARGYHEGVEVDACVELRDDLIPENAGRWRLRIANGRGSAERTTLDGAAFRCNIRTMGALFSGFLAPSQAILLGLAEGDAATAARLAGAFAGTAPWMVDHF